MFNIEGLDKVLIFILLALLALIVYFKISRQFEIEKIHGQLKGYIDFFEDRVIIDGVTYHLDQLSKIEINYGDYYSSNLFSSGLEPALSNGTQNRVTLFLNNGEELEVLFQVKEKDFLSGMRTHLISYHKKDKISWVRLMYDLRLNDYDEIQAFKKSLKETNGLL
ncbi:hypothetical protein [Arcticibacterium luteifluviistationis]|uniref:hypothetical protein n=1 Tax=Arcticibacterium luteifluviistationis TaxID=1784714 RepID=UPI0013A6C83E|nr:hypothetical protein [Arcticibacterium luteifluviistationis]